MVESYRNKEGKVNHRAIKRYGNLAKLIKADPNIIQRFRSEAKAQTALEKIELNVAHRKSLNDSKRSVNYGYFFMERIFRDLGIDWYLKKYNQASSQK